VPAKDPQRAIRKQLVQLLAGKGAHVSFDEAVKGLAPTLRGLKPPGQPHTAWRLLEHLRIAQWDILEFSRDPKHQSPEWPDGYWPRSDAPPRPVDWNASIRRFRADLKAMQDLVSNPRNDLLVPIPHGQGQTLLREAVLVIDHNAYHLGQLMALRRILGAWKD
jgi:hypothetical protein